MSAIIHIGKRVPKTFTKLGYREVSAMHIGHGVWFIRLEKSAIPCLRTVISNTVNLKPKTDEYSQ